MSRNLVLGVFFGKLFNVKGIESSVLHKQTKTTYIITIIRLKKKDFT